MKKLQAFLQEQCDQNEPDNRLEEYFETKGKLMFELHANFHEAYSVYEEMARPDDDYSSSIDWSTVDVEEIIIDLLKQILVDNYEPPAHNLTGLDYHIWTLATVYKRAAYLDIEFDLNTILKLDIAALRLSTIVASGSIMLKSDAKSLPHKQAVKLGNKRQGEASLKKVLDAYEALGARWDDKIKDNPIFIEDKNVSLNGFANEYMNSKKGLGMDPKTIVLKLRELKKRGNI